MLERLLTLDAMTFIFGVSLLYFVAAAALWALAQLFIRD